MSRNQREVRATPEMSRIPKPAEHEPQTAEHHAHEAVARMTRLTEGIPESEKKSILTETIEKLGLSKDARLAAALVAILNISYPFHSKHAEGEIVESDDAITHTTAGHKEAHQTPPLHHHEHEGSTYSSEAQNDASNTEHTEVQVVREAETIRLDATFPRAIRWERPVSRKYTEIDPIGESSQYMAQLNELERTFFTEVRAQIPELQNASDEELAQLTDVSLTGESAASIEGPTERNQGLSEIEATRCERDMRSVAWQALGGVDRVTIQVRGVGEKVVHSEGGNFRELPPREIEDTLMKKHHIRSRRELHRQVQVSTGFTAAEKKMRDAFNAKNPDRAADFVEYYTQQRGVFFDVAFQLRTPQLKETPASARPEIPVRKTAPRPLTERGGSQTTEAPGHELAQAGGGTIEGPSLHTQRIVRDMPGEKGRVHDEILYGLEKREATPAGAPGPTPGPTELPEFGLPPRREQPMQGPEPILPAKSPTQERRNETPRLPDEIFDKPDIDDHDRPDKDDLRDDAGGGDDESDTLPRLPYVDPERTPVRVKTPPDTPTKSKPRLGGGGGGGGDTPPHSRVKKDAIYKEKPALPEGIVNITGGQGDKSGHTRMKNRRVKGRI